jgi:hypothetical protein
MIMRYSFWLMAVIVPVLLQAFENRCGDCWCVPEGGVIDGTCPSFDDAGLHQSFPEDWADFYNSFRLESDPRTLAASDGSADCFPFANEVGPLENYPGSNFPPCVIPETKNTSVCAYKYANASAPCQGRSYDMKTYDTDGDAVSDGANVIHFGACGVCSSAQDLATRITINNALLPIGITCTVQQ